ALEIKEPAALFRGKSQRFGPRQPLLGHNPLYAGYGRLAADHVPQIQEGRRGRDVERVGTKARGRPAVVDASVGRMLRRTATFGSAVSGHDTRTESLEPHQRVGARRCRSTTGMKHSPAEIGDRIGRVHLLPRSDHRLLGGRRGGVVLEGPFILSQEVKYLRILRVSVNIVREVQNLFAHAADAEHVVADATESIGGIGLDAGHPDDVTEAAETEANPCVKAPLAMEPVDGLIAVASYDDRIGDTGRAKRIVATRIIPAGQSTTIQFADEVDRASILLVEGQRAKLGADRTNYQSVVIMYHYH